jgi:CSLREA domain-containing protein
MLSITVNTLADVVDFNDGVTSLREAIFAANTVPGADTIDFAPALTANGPGTILPTQGELKVTDALTITGPGANLLTIDASGSGPTPDMKYGDGSRIFNIDDGDFNTHEAVSISGLTLTGGDSAFFGGAIQSSEDLSLTGMVIS